MQITKEFIKQLRNRLKTGNRGTAYLDATPTTGKQKIDLDELKGNDKHLAKAFLNWLLDGTTPTFTIPNTSDALSNQAISTIENLITKSTGIELERGINTLAFGYPLLVRRDKKDRKLIVAPLLLWSLRVKRSNNSWKVICREDDLVYPNEVLQNHLFADSTIDIKDITQNFLNQEEITQELLKNYCSSILQTLNDNLSDYHTEIATFDLMECNSILSKEEFLAKIEDRKASIYSGGIFSLFEAQKQSIIEDYEELLKADKLVFKEGDYENMPFQSLSSVETDPSQQGVLNTMKLQRNILIQGPPGTGKSQTLRAILVNALENGKRTVVVCEKRTALEVLESGLAKMNLEDLCVLIKDTKSDRKETIKKARNKIDNLKNAPRVKTTKIALEQYNEGLQKLIDTINDRHKKIGESLLGEQDWTEVVGLLVKEKREGGIKGKRPLPPAIFTYEDGELNKYLYFLDNAQPVYDNFFSAQPYSFWNSEKLVGTNPYDVQTKIKADVNYYLQASKLLIEEIENYKETYFKLRLEEFNKDKIPIKDGIRELKAVIQKNSANDAFFDRKKTQKWYYQLSAILNKSYVNTITDQDRLRELFAWLYGQLIQSDFFGSFPLNPSIKENLEFLEGLENKVVEKEKNIHSIIQQEIDKLDFIKDSIKHTTTEYHLFIERSKQLQERMSNNQWLIQQEPIPEGERIGTYGLKLALTLSEKIENEAAFYAAYEWYNFRHQATQKQNSIIDVIKYSTNWKQTFIVNYLDALLQKNATNELPRSNKDWDKISHLIENKGNRQVKYINKLWGAKQYQAITRFNQTHDGFFAKNLYNYRRGSKYKSRHSLRFITDYDANLFTTIFPIVLTTPTACSHLFQDKVDFFDIVLFDEASQLQLPDTFPALLKGKQCIIAGDKHQMPPSNLFQKSIIDAERTFKPSDENIGSNLKENLLLKSESLLDFAETMRFEEVNLDFHYRSQHPYLIDFSNHAFYEKRLIPQPKVEDYKPIVFVHLADAIYVNTVNEVEADMVLSILENNIHPYPDGTYPTVGIATINESQQKLIAKKINDARNDDPESEFAHKLNQFDINPKGTLFVKNLERLQGDERDVLIISTNYGKNATGDFSRNFSLLNRETGYRRLNVLITRAKCKIYLCTSIPEKEFLNYRTELKTYGNNKRAILYAYLAYAKAVSEGDDDSRQSILNALLGLEQTENSVDSKDSTFKQEIYQKLVEKYGTEKVKMNEPYAGYILDILFYSNHKIVIDCDGTINHNSEEAYLYDYHREKKLTSYGFTFHRIWSTRWWIDDKGEFDALCRFIDETGKKPIVTTPNLHMQDTFSNEVDLD